MSNAGRKRALWAKVGCTLAAAGARGVIGSAPAGGAVRLLSLTAAQPALFGAAATVLFLFVFLGWKVAWQAIAIKNSTQASWSVVLMPYSLALLALGLW